MPDLHASPSPARHAGATSRGADAVGPLLRDWRARRRRSQLDLALDVGVSPRHLSFVETGRAQASAAMLLAIAEGLDLPLRERNRLLLAGGYAPRYPEHGLDEAGMAQVRASLQRLLDAHDPYPGLVVDRQWNVVLANRAAATLATLVPPALLAPTLNVYRASLHPDGLAAFTVNFADWAPHLLAQLRRAVAGSGDAGLAALEAEVRAYPNVADLPPPADDAAPALLLPMVLDLPAGRVSMFTTITTFGTPRDVTLEELSVELFYPSDPPSEGLLRRMAA
jgi:transcriptional regulator with XRE-family HTH domain